MNDLNLYAAAFSVGRNGRIDMYACSVVAANEDEAVGKSLRGFREEFSVDEGWYGHQVSVLEVNHDFIRDCGWRRSDE